MKAIRYEEYGDADVLRLADCSEPVPGAGELRIEVRAAGVNGIDWKIRAGYLRDVMPITFPAGTGLDAAGVVEAVGPDVDVAVGERVFGNGRDTVAESAVLTSWASIPDGVSFEQAAGYPLPVETAFRILRLAGLVAGETVLISGASGGVGSAAVQIARDLGGTVIGTAREDRQDYLRGLGAEPTTYGPGLSSRVRALAPQGVDAALDLAGSGILPELIELTGDASRVVSIADFSAPELGAKVSAAAEDFPGALSALVEKLTAGRFAIPVDRRFPLAETAAAHDACSLGHAAGRIVVTVS